MRPAARQRGRGLRRVAMAWLCAWLASFAVVVAAEVAIPPVARVSDVGGALDATARTALEERLAALEARKGAQVAVIVLPTTQPETIEAWGIRVADAWKLGRKGVDDGVILIVATDDRRLRIEVGRGLEGALPDATSRRIIDEHIVPRLKIGDLAGALEVGVDRIAQVIDGEPLPAPEPRERSGERVPSLFEVVAVIALFGGAVLRAVFGRVVGGVLTGGVVGIALRLLVGGIALPLIGAAIAGVLVVAFGSVGGVRGLGRGGWVGGTGGGFGGRGGGGGGFGGGGGGFGGGGASGRW
jgi:uncharacterized protein